MRTERVLGIIFLLALICRLINFFPGFSTLIVFSGAALSILYFPMAFYFFSDKSLKKQNIAFSIVGGFVFSNACMGVIFKIMRWPGSYVTSLFSIVGIAALLVVFFIISPKANEELKTYYTNYRTRLIYWGTLSIVFFFLTPRNILQIEHRRDKKMLDIELKIMDSERKGVEEPQLRNYYHYKDSLLQANEGYTNYVRRD